MHSSLHVLTTVTRRCSASLTICSGVFTLHRPYKTLQHVLLLVPDVVSTSRPSWGNFIGCQCDSASWIQADSFGVQSAKWPVSTVFGGWLPASLLPADDDCDHQTGSLIHCCWTASVEPLEQPSWLVAYSTVGGTPVGELTLSCARPSANGWPLCG